MNRICRRLLVLFTGFLMVSCASLPKDEDQKWRVPKDNSFELLVQSDGFHVKNNLSANYKNVVFHVQKIDLKSKTITDDSLIDLKLGSSKSEKFYPFVQRGQAYRVFITYEGSKSNTSEFLDVIATGGEGEYSFAANIEPDGYDSSRFSVLFSNYSVTRNIIPVNEKVSGQLFSVKKNKSIKVDPFEINKNTISLKPYLGSIKNSKFWLNLVYSFEYNNETYFKAFFNNKKNPFTDTNKKFTVVDSGLPAVYMYTNSGKFITSRFDYVKGKIKIDGKVYEMQVRGRGNSSWGQMPKHSYNIKLKEKNSLLHLTKSKKWVALSNYADKTLIRNEYIAILGTKVFNRLPWTPSYKQVDLFINDDYQGTYLFGERISTEESRLNLPKGSFMFEMNRREDEPFNFRTKHDVSVSLKEPEKPDAAEKKRIRSIIQTAENALFSKDFKDNEKGYKKYFDVDSFVDWYILNEYSKNIDSAWFSSIYIVYNSKDKKIHMGPLWDYDLGFGNVSQNGCDSPEGYYIRTKGVWYAQMFKDPAFREQVKNRWNEKKSEVLKSIDEGIPQLCLNIRDSSYYNFDLWPVFGVKTWRDPAGFESRLTYESEVKYFVNWCKKRYDWMDKQFNSL